tara:strand:+ start:3958 stop:4155 length:198 start_codon:yes stop_codon:yes gene_type:complete
MSDHDYAAGLRDGEIKALREMQLVHSGIFEKHDKRLGVLEKTSYLFMGAVLLIQFAPSIQNILGI